MKKIICYFDGACEPYNPGGAIGYGVVIFDNNSELFSHSHFSPPNPSHSSNVAEYQALLWGFEKLLLEKLQSEEIIIRGDSQLAIKQMTGVYRINKGLYVPIAGKAKSLLQHFPNISFEWIPREQNEIADGLSKKALLENNITIVERKK